ncbi:MAG: helix-turn-helix transcriptional regulator [Sulfurimonas sp.]|nr:helix-turn-helix transcriptional regulator [Sulfurimonas sp.]
MIEFSEKEIENFYRKIGENAKTIRKEKNISQIQLALAIGHNSLGHVAKAELCKYNKHFSLEQLYKISRILKVSLHELLPE